MNKSSSWLYTQSVGKIQSSGVTSCYLCGMVCSKEHTVARGLADTFNSHYLALCPSSPSLCTACQWYFDGKANHPDFRKMSIIVAERVWCQWDRATMKRDIIQWLTCGLDADAYLVVSLSKKKHILLQAPLNTAGSQHLSIQVEEQVAHCTLAHWDSIHTPFMTLMQLGHGKGEILSGTLYGSTLKRHGQIAQALALSEQLAPWRQSPLIGLISYVTLVEDKQEESLNATDDIATNTGRVHSPRSTAPVDDLERNQQGVSQSLSHKDMGAIRGECCSVRPDDERSRQVHQSALWGLSGIDHWTK